MLRAQVGVGLFQAEKRTVNSRKQKRALGRWAAVPPRGGACEAEEKGGWLVEARAGRARAHSPGLQAAGGQAGGLVDTYRTAEASLPPARDGEGVGNIAGPGPSCLLQLVPALSKWGGTTVGLTLLAIGVSQAASEAEVDPGEMVFFK